ncbi:uncharacterized protein LOC123526703 [Mercenaria mercenaria]|uniref:uncharacterized protein LOC123526703 n=1 Tax=Mercenaria mercenaria TaxID=6596 RepID=UPI001E1DF8AD|nr:uncharacterized protein LOC123526703 [Mercenaria mercenaria]
MDDLSDMTLDKFRLWSVHALKVFLSHRKRSVNGTFDELSARAFCVWEENLPVDEKAEQAEQRLLQEYKAKLHVDKEVVPDPFSLKVGWKGEKTGMRLWPPVYITDISAYLNCSTPKEVIHRILNEYKQGKAYRYFENKWVKEVFVHEIRENSDKCILKTKVTPSMSINSKAYDVWAVIRKDTQQTPGGEILSAYCTCTAGMLGTCNHVAGMLFKIEHATKTGETSKTCTDRLCEWNVAKAKPSKKPVKAGEVTWRKGHYSKSARDLQVEKEKHVLKKEFTPLTKDQSDNLKNQTKARDDLFTLLKDDISNSCFSLLHEKKRVPAPKQNIPPSLLDIAKELKPTESVSPKTFLSKIELTSEQCDTLRKITVEQSCCETWKEQRKGRITASVFQRVSSRVDTLRKDSTADPSALVSAVLGRKETYPTKAMKHGLSLENQAKKSYSNDMKKVHRKFKSSDSGLSVYVEKPFIAASADLEVECDCCGKGLCEIKCPETIKDTVPTTENVKYLSVENGQLVLDQKHPYYYQIQGQMKVLDRNYCDFFVYTVHGSLCMRETFNNDFWQDLEQKLTWFWLTHVFPALTNGDEESDCESKENQAKTPTKPLIPSSVCRALTEITLPQSKKPCVQMKKRRKTTKKTPIYLCGICGCDCVDDPQTDADQSVNCDGCYVWVHYICAGVTDKTLQTLDKWLCTKCKPCLKM